MKNYQAHKSSLFLMELIFAIVFFALASSVCLQLFAKSRLLSKETRELNAAIIQCSSVAESLRQLKGDDSMISYYDHDFKLCSSDDAAYYLTIKSKTENTLYSADIQFYSMKEDRLIYQLPVKVVIPILIPKEDTAS